MLQNAALYSRLLFMFALVYAAVMSLITCSDAARASPITTQVDNGVRHKVIRRLYIPHNPLFTGLPSTETGLQNKQTGANGETDASGNYRASSIIYHESNPLRLTEGFRYNRNSPDNRQSQEGTTRVQSGLRPASSYHPLSANSYKSNSVIIRKSSLKEAAIPFHQRSSPSQVWDAQNSYIKEKVPRYDSPSLFSPQTGRYWSTSLPTSRGNYKETNELAGAGAPSASSRILSSTFFGFASQTGRHAPSFSNSLGDSAIKSIPSPETLTSSSTDFSQGLHSVSSSQTPGHKKVQSYLFKDSQSSFGGHETVNTAAGDGPRSFPTTPHKQWASDAQVHSRLFSNVKQSQRKDPTKDVQPFSHNGNPLYHNTNVAQYGAQTDHFNTFQPTTQTSEHLVFKKKDATVESFVSIPQADFQGNYSTGSDKSVVSIKTTTRGPMHEDKPEKNVKNIYGFRGFESPTWRVVKNQLSNERINSRRYSFEKGKDNTIAKIYPSLSSRYSFGQRQASTPAKLERTPTEYPSPSPGTLDIAQTKTTPRPFIPGFKKDLTLQLNNDAGMDSNQNRRQYGNYKRIYGLKGFGTRPLEGAETVVSEPEKPVRVQQGFKGFLPRSSEISQPESSHVSTMSRNELSSEDLKPILKTAGSTESVTRFTPDRYQKRRKIYTFLGFQPVQHRIGNANKTASHLISRSAEIQPSPKFEPNLTQHVALSPLSSLTSTTVRGKRVKGNRKKPNESTLTNDNGNAVIVRLPKPPAKVVAITYADILGSASFSGVTATTQTPIIPADKDYIPDTTATTEQKEVAGNWTLNSEDAVLSRDNTSKGPEEHEVDFSAVEENKLGEEVDTKTSDLFLDYEGSGSGGFNMSDVFSTNTKKSQGLSVDLLELDLYPISQ